MDISVVVPVHNAENTLDDCVASLLTQKGCSFEIILVENGSKDNSLEKCDAFSVLYDNVSVFKIDQPSVMRARNLGIENSRGEFIVFCDSDDWYDSEALAAMLKEARRLNTDIVKCGYKKRIHPNNPISMKKPISEKTKIINKADWSYEDYARFFNPLRYKAPSSMCGSLFRRSFILGCIPKEIRENPLRRGEDLLFNYVACSCAPLTAYMSDCLYNYRIGGVTSSNYRLIDDLFLYKTIVDSLNITPEIYKDKLNCEFAAYVLNTILTRYAKCSSMTKNELLDFYSEVVADKRVCGLVQILFEHQDDIGESDIAVMDALKTGNPNMLLCLARKRGWIKRAILKGSTVLASF